MAVPLEIQVPLFSKILSFDRNLKSRAGSEIVMGIVFQSKFRTSLNARIRFEQVVREIGIKEINGIRVTLVPLDIYETGLEKALTEHQVDIVYITPLRAVDIKEISELCRKQKVLSLSGVPGYCNSGLIVGVGIKGGKPEIIVNLQKAKDIGVDFRSQLLKLARIVN